MAVCRVGNRIGGCEEPDGCKYKFEGKQSNVHTLFFAVGAF